MLVEACGQGELDQNSAGVPAIYLLESRIEGDSLERKAQWLHHIPTFIVV